MTPVPGTTRDLITETVDINGLRVTLVDSAGIRDTDDSIESIGVDLAQRAMQAADVVFVVIDGSVPLDDIDAALLEKTSHRKRVVISNKSDIGTFQTTSNLAVSAKTGAGLEALRDALYEVLDGNDVERDRPAITNLRHLTLVQRADDALGRARDAIAHHADLLSEEFVLADLQAARDALEDISGRRTPEDVLARIFSRFCIGK